MSINTKKWFGRAVMLALTCFLFLGLKDRVEAKADDPEPPVASARLIYANNLDEGFPTGDTTYLFQDETPSDGYEPYAVYVTNVAPASGSAITLDSRVIDIDYSNIRIWDNNCAIVLYAGGVNVEKLVFTGSNSYLNFDWRHIYRGECAADEYSGPDDASEIAAYFNNFNENDDYRNEVDVTLRFNQNNIETNPDDPHFGKTVYNFSQDMYVANLTLEANVVAFIKDETNDQNEVIRCGMLHISRSLNIGSNSYIEGYDDSLRLEINEDFTTVSGMTLYDLDDYGSTVGLESDNLKGLYYCTGSPIIWVKYRPIDQPVNIPDDAIGRPEVTTAAKKYIFAYANMDYDGNRTADDGKDLKFALAAELANLLKHEYGIWYNDRWNTFGLPADYEVPREDLWREVSIDAGILSNRIQIDYDNPYEIIVDGDENPISRYTATITWGKTIDGEVIEGSVYVYQLNTPEDVLICTDFDENTGTGNTFFVRNNGSKKLLVGPEDAPWEYVDEDFIASEIITDSIGKVAAGGHAVALYEKNVDNNLYTFQTISYFFMRFMERGEWHELYPETFVKIFTPSGKYFAVAGEGEEKRYDWVSNANNNSADDIWEAGGDAPVKLFIHNDILHIMPLNSNSGAGKALKEVRLTGDTPQRAVDIDNTTNPLDLVITFKSKFYDTVTFELEYEDGTTGSFTVDREGINIWYAAPQNQSGTDRYWFDVYGENNSENDPSFTYTYTPATENLIIMATYYHSSDETGINDLKLIITYDDDGSIEVLSSNDVAHHFTGYHSGEGFIDNGIEAVDTTTFIIGSMKNDGRKDCTFSANGHTGGFSVQIVNADYDAADSFGGALTGSGKGKHWNGEVHFSY